MALKTQEHFRGFLVPSPFNVESIDYTSTTATQSGSRCGSPQNLTQNDMSLSSFGDQDDIQDITIETIKGGTPGNVDNPAMFKFFETGESTYYGQFGRNAVSGFEMIAAETTQQYNYPYFQPLSNGDKLVAYQRYTTGNNKYVLVDKCLNTDTSSTWTNKLTLEVQNTSSMNIFPSMCMMDDNSILLAFIQVDDSTNYANISIYRSTNDGDTWTLVNTGCLDVKINILEQIPQRIRMAYSRGQTILILEHYWYSSLETHRNRIIQYLSVNGGMTFSKVDESIAGDGYIYRIDLYTDTNGDFIFTWIRNPDYISILSFSDGGSSIVDQIVGNDYVDIVDFSGAGSSALSTSTESGNLLNDGECTSYELPNGEKHLVFRLISFISPSNYFSTNFYYSIDGELDGFQPAINQNLVDHKDTITRLIDIHARYVDGRSGLFSSNIASPGPDDNSVHVIWYNQMSNVSLEVSNDIGIYTNKFDPNTFRYSWFPFDEPQATGNWTRTTAGSVSDTIQDGRMRILCTSSGGQIYYTDVNLGATSIIRFRCQPTIGGSNTDMQRGVELIYDDGADRYVVEIRIDTNAIDIFDVAAATSIGDSSGHNGEQIEFLISFSGDHILVWDNYDVYRSRKTWRLISDSAVSSTTSTGSENTIRWGHITTSTSQVNTYWYEFHVGSGVDAFDTIQPLIGVPYPSTGLKQFVNGGCSISTIDGPARIGDQYRIKRQYDFALERVMFDVNTSPRVKWRSTNTSTQDIVWYTYGNDTNRDIATNNMGAITLLGCNFREFTLYYEAFGTWTSMGTINMSNGLVCDLIRIGSTVRSTTSGGGSFYAFENEFAGCICELTYLTTTKYRRIISNSSGVMGSTTGKTATFVLDGIDDTEPTTGTFKVYSKQVTITHSVLSSSRWKISFPTQTIVDPYFEIGQIIHGSMFIFAPQYGRGRSITYESNTDIYQTTDNQIKTRVRSIGHRTARISWTDPVDQTTLFESSFDGDYFSTLNTDTQTYSIANFGDIPYSMIGLYTYLDGAGKPIVYIPSIKAGLTSRTLNRYQDFIYGITTSNISIDNVLGDENVDECYRVSQIDIREIT